MRVIFVFTCVAFMLVMLGTAFANAVDRSLKIQECRTDRIAIAMGETPSTKGACK